MNQKNGKKMTMAFAVVAVLVGMAFLGLVVPSEANGEIMIDNHLVDSISLGSDWAYSTSTVDVDITYSLAPVDETLELSNLTITVELVGTMPVQLYMWNLTTDGGSPMNPYTWSLDGTQTVGDYILNVTADYYNGTDEMGYTGSEEAHFQVIEGMGLFGDLSATPAVVDNSGMDMVNVSVFVNRMMEEIDHNETMVSFFHVDSMTWVSDEVLEFEPEDEDVMEGVHNASAFDHILIPMDLPVGDYKLYFNLYDIWGYNESTNVSMFRVIMKEMAPEMNNDTIFMHEDMYAVVDLDDHFMDVNGQDLMYYINLSNVENITIAWVDETTINITAPANWNGVQMFKLNVTDGINMAGHNLTFTLTVEVMAVPDELMAAEDLTIEIDEVDMEVAFSALDLFYNPDGPVTDLGVSLGWEWAVNETNVSYMMPVWTWMDANFSVMINETDNTDAMAMMLTDLEEGSTEVPVSAWINGTFIMNATAVVEITPVNDVPVPIDATIMLYMNEAQTFNMSALFVDADSMDLNFSVNDSKAMNVAVAYNWETLALTLTPALDWTGTTMFNVTATDGVDEMEYTMTINVMKRSYTVTGSISFEVVDGVDVNLSNITMTIGDNLVVLNETGAFSMVLLEGDYAVTVTIPAALLYSEADNQSGYEMVDFAPINLTGDQDYALTVSYMVYTEPNVQIEASWSDLDFQDGVQFDDDDDLMVILNVKESAINNTGFDVFVVKLIVGDYNYTMTWDPENKYFYVVLTGDDLDDIGEGKKAYYFSNENGSLISDEEKYEFKDEDENGGPMTIIILVALILLVLVALIFIMKKPSEEDFDEEEEEEEEEGRTCPGCGEVVTDDEAEECPYCGEDMEEE